MTRCSSSRSTCRSADRRWQRTRLARKPASFHASHVAAATRVATTNRAARAYKARIYPRTTAMRFDYLLALTLITTACATDEHTDELPFEGDASEAGKA